MTAEDDEFDPLAASADTGEIVVGARPGLDEPPGWAGSDSAPGDAPDPAGDGIEALPELGADEEPAQLQLEEEADDGRGGPGREVDGDDLTPQGRYRASVTEDPEFVWRVPNPRFLTRSTGAEARPDTAGQAQTARSLVQALGHFGIEAQVVGKVSGPHITRYEIRLAPGVKMSKVANLKDDLAYALAATDIRILAPIPGKQAVGIEVPNARRRIVHLGDVIGAAPEDWSPLTVWLGKDIAGNAVGADLAKMPHLLVAGTTGAGKSACVNAMLSSILLRATPHEVRLVLVDPKQVELNHYESIPHLLTPVITSPRQAANALQNLVREMEQRYSIMQLARTRSLPDLNRVRESRGEPPLPYILCVIDELADLMMVAPADVEDSIIRLAQKARAVGMHLVLATQSPRVDVITGMIKANVPSRIAFAVSSQTDSRVILDQNGAESLLGQGDMLFSPVGSSRLQRIQGAFVDEPQILEITEAWRKQGEPDLQEELLEEVEPEDGGDAGAEDPNDADSDPLLEEAISLVAQMGTASTSMLQRRLRLGYTRAGRLIDMLERRGIISGYEGSKPRQVLITEADVG
ncbi:MAG: DNA translocase FtsK, partial [Solirubrobacteraceae bacterium]